MTHKRFQLLARILFSVPFGYDKLFMYTYQSTVLLENIFLVAVDTVTTVTITHLNRTEQKRSNPQSSGVSS